MTEPHQRRQRDQAGSDRFIAAFVLSVEPFVCRLPRNPKSAWRRIFEEAALADSSVAASTDALLRVLCVIVFAIITGAVVYTAWISISNFSRIGV